MLTIKKNSGPPLAAYCCTEPKQISMNLLYSGWSVEVKEWEKKKFLFLLFGSFSLEKGMERKEEKGETYRILSPKKEWFGEKPNGWFRFKSLDDLQKELSIDIS